MTGTCIKGKKVIIGLSGGVDSAVAALLLKKQGAIVEAIHMTNWEDDKGYCNAAEDLQDARKICKTLNLPLHHVNFTRQYNDLVFKNFLQEYKNGRTPNPDVLCNREIKFGVLRKYVHRLGVKIIATGHYAKKYMTSKKFELYKAADKNKDQTYFLYSISSESLAETIFPLGDLLKKEVREIAYENNLTVHNKKDSTGICFIGERPFQEFLSDYFSPNPGPIITVTGKKIGAHNGLMFYTLGQRQGIGIGGRSDSNEKPWYVVKKDLQKNALIVAQGDHETMYSNYIELGNPFWIGDPPKGINSMNGIKCCAKIRYRQKDQKCNLIEIEKDRFIAQFEHLQRSVTPGQSAVFYKGERCLGGAIIDSANRKNINISDVA